MKKISLIISGLALIATSFSCQRVDIDSNTEITGKPLKVTAYIDGNIETRMSYTPDNTANTITPAWQNGDVIIGFDDAGGKFTFTVERTSSESEAVLNTTGYTPAANATTVYAIFYPGKTIDDFASDGNIWKLPVDLARQGGVLDASTPALMCATGSIENNEVELHFTNQTAIIGVKKFQLNGTSSATTVTGLTLNGVITDGIIAVDSTTDKLKLTPGSTISSITASGSWGTDASGVCTTAVYFAAMPTDNADLTLSATTGTSSFDNLSSIKQNDLEAGKYYYMSKKLGTPVAAIGRERYETIDAAWAAAKASATPCTVTLLSNITHNSQLDFSNDNNNAITLDLNGKILSTSTAQFLTSSEPGASLTIVDNGFPKGKITSSASKVLNLTTASSTVTLNGCVIEGTKAEGAAYNTDPLIDMCSTSGTLTINNAQVYTTAKLSVLRAYSGTTTINGSELSSGTQSEGWYVIIGANDGMVNMTSGSLYTSGTGNSSTFHISYDNSTMTVADGCYLYSNGRVVSGGQKSYYNRITLNGGFYNKEPSVPTNGTGSSTPSYGAGLYMLAIDPAETNTHNTIGETLEYGYQVKEAPITSVAIVNCEPFNDFAEAVSFANDYSDERNVNITLLQSFTHYQVITLRNSNSKTVTLDLNGQTLTAGVARFIQGSKFIITDSEGTGKIESAFNEIIYPNYSNGSATLNGCKIVSTIEKGKYYYSNRAVACFANNCTLTITGNTIIEANQTCVYCGSSTAGNSPKVIIERATLNSSGSYCIYTSATGVVTINGGTYRSNAYVCGYIGNTTASFIINHGFFSRGGSGNLLSGSSGYSYTLNGGYYSQELSFADANIIQLATPVTVGGITYTHAHTSEVNTSDEAAVND
ncbi:MAG: hypothetical protein IKR30_07505 [Bacteroidales bacterium]|nr:hypothetical protein [Bacteroidales bacterium]